MKKKAQFGSDLIIDILKQHHIEYVAFNPGATFRGLHDSLVNNISAKHPELLMCCHEEISVAIAHGYAKAAHKPMAVFVHANIGLQHASMAIFNAWCDRVPMMIIGGVGPLDTSKRRPWIDWIHTSHHQESIIRDYVKWADQPYNLASTPESLYRAFKITNSEPKAPVYVGIDALIQEEVLGKKIALENPKKYAPATPPSADENTLKKIAAELIQAKFPLIIADYPGRNPDAVNKLVELAERLSIPVIDQGGRYNFPNTHPFCLTGMPEKLFRQVDFILALDVHDLSGTLGEMRQGKYQSYLQKNTKIVHVTLADHLISQWAADYHKLYPVDETIAADTTVFLTGLMKISEKLSPKHQSKRVAFIKKVHQVLRTEWKEEALKHAPETPLAAPAVLHEVWQVIKNEDWILANNGGAEISKWVKKLWELNQPGCHVGESGGAGLGYGLGAAIGVALAHQKTKKICINLQADGDFLFTPSALWTAAHYEVPLLIIMMNNRSYNNSKEHAAVVAQHRQRNIKNAHIGTSFETPVNYPLLAKSFGIESGKTIEHLSEIQSELQKAIAYIKQERKPYLLDIVIQ